MTRTARVLLPALLMLAACAPTVGIGEKFTVGADETVRVRGTGLTIQVSGVGREYLFDGDEQAFIDMTVRLRGEERAVSMYVADDFTIGDFIIHVHGCEPFRDYTCDLSARRADD